MEPTHFAARAKEKRKLLKNAEEKETEIQKREIPLMFIGLALLIGSFYWRLLFHFFFIIPSLIFFMRSMDDFKKGDKKSMYVNLFSGTIFFALIFLANTD